ncbi:tRNA (adenosine(37)-N6)-threonylcarbamoyltransferase complex transferase subunit TsaD [Patescibacteria group bacterium]|nr:tRNA (adenosine(37)-N6)-threonylcarbamoyltransferase complex transferase subunit TsaD [Patescibacteria group bacterium]
MNILSIETSCDDTCVAIIEAKGQRRPRFNILSNIVSSQVEIHKKWGGVYPTLAKREHQKNLPLVLEKALKKAKNPKIDLITVTVGPGLEPCLWVGVNFAKALANFWNLPIVPVNHIEAHIFANFIKEQKTKNKEQLFPAICLVVSGGHTQLILMKDFGKYKILGETRDDAAGECFDKVAKILGLEYPGGPAIAIEASRTNRGPSSVSLPRPMIKQKNYDFSFSGLKTAVLYNFKTQPQRIRKSKKYIREMCKETQQAIIDVLVKKTIKAAKDYKAESIILGGGVSANKELRKQFQRRIQKEKLSFRFQVPSFKFCTDNAVMIGIAGYFNWLKGKGKPWKKIKADANLKIC